MTIPWSHDAAQPPILGFGCARLTANNSVREALHNLSTAYDHGIRYFDTARLYGYGRAEAILGNFIRDKRDKVMIATKAGLNPREFHGLIGLRMLNLSRQGAKALGAFRKTASPGASPLIGQRITDPKLLRQSLERSLKELRTEYVDVFLLHEFTITEANREEVVRFGEDIIREGKVKRIGIGSESCRDINEGDLHNGYTLIQHEYDLFRGGQYGNLDMITRSVHGIFRLSYRLAERNGTHVEKQLEEIVGDRYQDIGLHGVLLKCAQFQNANGIVLFASAGNHRITEAVNIWHGPVFTQQQVEQIANLFRNNMIHA